MQHNDDSIEFLNKIDLLEQTCRTCTNKYQKENLYPIFEYHNMESKILIFDEIQFMKLQILKDDGLPEQICGNCFNNFTNINSFRNLCEASQLTLKNIFHINNNLQIENCSSYNNNKNCNAAVAHQNLETQLMHNDNILLDKSDVNLDSLELEPLIYKNTINNNINNINNNNNIDVLEECEKLLLEESFKSKDDINLLTEIDKYLQNTNKDDLIDIINLEECNSIYNQIRNIDNNLLNTKDNDEITSNNNIDNNNKKKLNEQIPNNCRSCILYDDINIKLKIFYNDINVKKNLVCPVCSRRLKNSTALKLHVMAHKNRTKCKIHNIDDYEQQQEKSKLDNNKINIIICHICDKSFKTRDNLRIHINDNHRNNKPIVKKKGSVLKNENPFKCNICNTNEEFSSQKLLDKHQNELHLKKSLLTTSSTSSSPQSSTSSSPSSSEYKCLICNKICLNKHRYKYHIKTHDDKKQFQCKYCEKSFMQRHHLSNHENTHTGLKPYLCSICGRSFKQELLLTDHIKHHNGILGYPCNVCGKKFTSRSGNLLHMRTHNGKRPYKCDICKLDFTQGHHLKQHIQKAHKEPSVKKLDESGDKLIEINKYKCPFCPKTFRFLSAMSNHTKIHSNDNDRIHACLHCDNRFKSTYTLTNHIKNIHLKEKPFGCEICNKKYTNKSDLRIHLRHHTKEKPFECAKCNKTFFTSTLLRYHQAVHTGEKKYRCDICGEQFLKNNQLQTHQEKKHTIEEKRIIAEKFYTKIKNSISKANGNEKNNELEFQDLYDEFLNI